MKEINKYNNTNRKNKNKSKNNYEKFCKIEILYYFCSDK